MLFWHAPFLIFKIGYCRLRFIQRITPYCLANSQQLISKLFANRLSANSIVGAAITTLRPVLAAKKPWAINAICRYPPLPCQAHQPNFHNMELSRFPSFLGCLCQLGELSYSIIHHFISPPWQFASSI